MSKKNSKKEAGEVQNLTAMPEEVARKLNSPDLWDKIMVDNKILAYSRAKDLEDFDDKEIFENINKWNKCPFCGENLTRFVDGVIEEEDTINVEYTKICKNCNVAFLILGEMIPSWINISTNHTEPIVFKTVFGNKAPISLYEDRIKELEKELKQLKSNKSNKSNKPKKKKTKK